jgi:hypothetical protein
MEKQYNYAASTTSQDVFHHVVRKLLPIAELASP